MGEVINFASISVYTLGIVAVFCYLWGGFVFYKKAMEAHSDEDVVFDIVVLSAFWAFIFGRIGFVLTHLSNFYGHWMRGFLLVNYPGVDRWGVVFGLIFGLLLIIRKKKGKYLDFLDLASLGYLSGVSYFWIGLNFVSFQFQNIIIALFNFGMFLLFWKLEKTYRLISWYRGSRSFAKSGLVSGLSVSAIALAFLLEKALYRQLSLLVFIWFVLLFISGLVLVYIRSGRVLVEDIKILKIWNKKQKK